MYQLISALLIAGMTLALAPSIAQARNNTPQNSNTTVLNSVENDSAEPTIEGSRVVDYRCAMGSSLTMYHNPNEPLYSALRWNKRLYRMKRVDTSTGANRFENHFYGLVWIGIPAKGMLLDSKRGKQLANDCISPEHR